MSEISQTSTRTHHSASVVLSDPVRKEWRRLMTRVRRKGPRETAAYVSSLVRKGGYPICYPYKFAKFLLKRREFASAGELLKITRRFGVGDFLIDELYGTWLWAMGKRDSAFRFVWGALKVRPHSCLFSLLSAMYRVTGNDRLAEKYLQIAGSLADRELRKNAANRPEVKCG